MVKISHSRNSRASLTVEDMELYLHTLRRLDGSLACVSYHEVGDAGLCCVIDEILQDHHINIFSILGVGTTLIAHDQELLLVLVLVVNNYCPVVNMKQAKSRDADWMHDFEENRILVNK